ncbi:phosphopantetheine-binding protein [Bacillus cereus]
MWEQILGVTPVSISTHFFEVGGHSLKAVSLIAAIERELSVKLSIKKIFEHPYLEEMAIMIEQEKIEKCLVFSQLHLRTIIQLLPINNGYMQSVTYRAGSRAIICHSF